MQVEQMKDEIVRVLSDAKAQAIEPIDVRKMTDIADYMVIASGTSTRHVGAVADRLVDEMRKLGCRALGSEGKAVGDWALIDFGDVIVHVMLPDAREHYQLEKLWSHGSSAEAATVGLPERSSR